MNATERWAVAVPAALCMFMFFFPAVITSLPIVGTRTATGYDVLVSNDFEEIDKQLRVATEQFDKTRHVAAKKTELPLSMRLGALIQLFLALAYLSGAVVFIGALGSDLIVVFGCVAGLLFSVAAIIHIQMFNADMHWFMQQHVDEIGRNAEGNPFAGLAQNIVQLMVSGFHLEAGFGLYVMAIAFALGLFIAKSRVLSRLTISIDRETDRDR